MRALLFTASLLWAASAVAAEEIPKVPMPPGFRIESTELEGPVFADPSGKTLYKWPFVTMRAGGVTGDKKGESSCTDKATTTSAGLMSPYPPGLVLPELDKRLSCAQVWPPVLAADDAQPIDKWSIIARKDGKKQWAYDGHPLYTSRLDQQPGDTLGGTSRQGGGDGPADRDPLLAPPAVPPGFAVVGTALGRLVVTAQRRSVYSYDKDPPGKSTCDAVCARTWEPLIAPTAAQAQGEWSIIDRAPGVRQWAFRKKPLYTHAADTRALAVYGNDLPGWRNVYTQAGPPAPAEFTVQDSDTGEVLADRSGKTLYVYNCGDDSFDQLACDHPDSPQVYRLAICGGGDAARCVKTWPYVEAPPGAKPTSRSWTVMAIDPMTGRLAPAGQGLRVWAYRGRPIYTYAGDKAPGDTNGNSHGEFGGKRNGFEAFILRDYYFNHAR